MLAAAPNPRALTVQATDTECKLSATSAPSGALTFAVTNGGSKVNEFYLYGEDGHAHRRRSGEYRPRHYAGAGAEGRARELHHGMQTWHGRRRHPRPLLGL